MFDVNAVLKQMREFCNAVRSGQWKGKVYEELLRFMNDEFIHHKMSSIQVTLEKRSRMLSILVLEDLIW